MKRLPRSIVQCRPQNLTMLCLGGSAVARRTPLERPDQRLVQIPNDELCHVDDAAINDSTIEARDAPQQPRTLPHRVRSACRRLQIRAVLSIAR